MQDLPLELVVVVGRHPGFSYAHFFEGQFVLVGVWNSFEPTALATFELN